MARLILPEGFHIQVFARDLEHPSMMAVSKDGTVYVTQPRVGKVTALRDANGDGTVERMHDVASGLEGVHGIGIYEGKLYLAGPSTVWAAEIERDGALGAHQVILDDLPEPGYHGRRTLGFGPEGMIYVSAGSSCNACVEQSPEHAAILRAEANGKHRAIFARGLRNTMAFGWHPETRAMWGLDQGREGLGEVQPPEELNRLEQGADYGWPYVFGGRQPDPQMEPPRGIVMDEYAVSTTPPVLTYQAHSTPVAMVFYTGTMFAPEYRDDAFVAMHGGWNGKGMAGYKVVRILFADGEPVGFEDFVTGFLIENGTALFGRPAGLAVAPDGALLIADDANGMIYRISSNV